MGRDSWLVMHHAKAASALEQLVNKHQHQPVLVVTVERECDGIQDIEYRPDEFTERESDAKLGIISGPFPWRAANGGIVLPTSGYIMRDGKQWYKPNDDHPEELAVLASELDIAMSPSKPIEDANPVEGGSETVQRVLVGRLEVETYFRYPHMAVWEVLQSYREGQTSKKELQIAARNFPETCIDFSYAKALRMLKAPVPDVFKKSYWKSLRAAQREIATDLGLHMSVHLGSLHELLNRAEVAQLSSTAKYINVNGTRINAPTYVQALRTILGRS